MWGVEMQLQKSDNHHQSITVNKTALDAPPSVGIESALQGGGRKICIGDEMEIAS